MLIIDTQKGNNNKHSGGLPHSEIHGSKLILSSPWLIAEYHVFHRLLLPRHPPNALFALDLIQKKSDLRLNDAKLVHQASHLPVKSHTFPLKHMSVCLNCWATLLLLGLVYLTWTTCSFQPSILKGTRGKGWIQKLSTSLNLLHQIEIIPLLRAIKQCWYLYLSKRCQCVQSDGETQTIVLRDLIKTCYMVEPSGIEPLTSWMQIRRSPIWAKAPYTPYPKIDALMVGRGGLEPPTSRLSGVRSNHLSYRPSTDR